MSKNPKFQVLSGSFEIKFLLEYKIEHEELEMEDIQKETPLC